jgi:hypothetical protein
MKYVLYFGFWIAVFYAVIRFGLSAMEDQGGKGSPEQK